MRSNSEDAAAFNQLLQSGRFSHSRKVLIDDVLVTKNGSLVNFFDANGANRTVTLPELEEGRFYIVANVGTANNLLVNSSTGTLVTTLLPSDMVVLVASDLEWMALRGWAALGVFTNTINGLVPAPNSIAPGSLFLRDDGQWAQVQVVGIVDAFKFMTDGTNVAIGSGPDTFWFRSSTNKIGITVTNGEAIFGDNVNLTVNEAQVDHDLLLNFFANEHIDHTLVWLTAGTGLSGGGDISASRTFNLDLNDLTTDTPVLSDTFAFYDVSGADTNKATLTVLNGILDHNALLNYSANRHIDHTAVSITASTGLTGGGDISATRSLALDFNGLVADSIVTGDFVAFYDTSGGDHNKITFANFNATLDHNGLAGYVADQHVAHSSVTMTAGAGLTGGGTIAATRTFDVGAGTGITVNANDVALDTAHVRNVDHTAVSISTTEGIQGGGDISVTRTLKLDINALTADATPDSGADYIVTWDASAGVHKKVLIANLPGGLNISGLTETVPAADDYVPIYDTSAAANRKVTAASLQIAKKNYIINGAMMVSQENGTSAGSTSGYYAVDKFSIGNTSAGSYSAAQVASLTPAGSPNRFRATVTLADASVAAGDAVTIRHAVEGTWIADLALGTASAKTVTLQFGVKAPAGTYGVGFRNSAANRSYAAQFVISGGEANTDVVKSVTIPLDQTGTWLKDTGVGLDILWSLMAGTTYHNTLNTWSAGNLFAAAGQFNFMGTNANVFELFDVSLTEGNVAPAFKVADYAIELALCQREYWRDALNWIFAEGYSFGVSANYLTSQVLFPVPMRVSPTITLPTFALTGVSAPISLGGANVRGIVLGALSTIGGGNRTLMTYSSGNFVANARL